MVVVVLDLPFHCMFVVLTGILTQHKKSWQALVFWSTENQTRLGKQGADLKNKDKTFLFLLAAATVIFSNFACTIFGEGDPEPTPYGYNEQTEEYIQLSYLWGETQTAC
jgi:hypothetical protein